MSQLTVSLFFSITYILNIIISILIIAIVEIAYLNNDLPIFRQLYVMKQGFHEQSEREFGTCHAGHGRLLR